MSILLAVLLVLAAAAGLGVVLSRKPHLQVMAMAADGVVLSLLFLAVLASIRIDRSQE